MSTVDSDYILAIWRAQMQDSSLPNREVDTDLKLPLVAGVANGKPYIMALSAEKPREVGSMRAITVTINDRRPSVSGENWALLFTLEDWSLRHAFAELCATFVARIRETDTQGAALEQIYASMSQWKRLLQPLPAEQTEQILLGVMAELTAAIVMQRATNKSMDTIIDCWTGPLGASQDFIFPSQEDAWEVKALHASTQSIMISSPEQLDTSNFPIQLVTVELERNTENDGKGIGLHGLMQCICDLSDNADSVRAKLEDGIFHAGLRVYSPSVQTALFFPHAVSVYDVHDDFPRVEASALPQGVVSLTYSIQRDAIEPYRILTEDNPLNFMENDH